MPQNDTQYVILKGAQQSEESQFKRGRKGQRSFVPQDDMQYVIMDGAQRSEESQFNSKGKRSFVPQDDTQHAG
jgi:hypothetical protein